MFKSNPKELLVTKEVIPVEQLESLKVALMIGIGNLKIGNTSDSIMEASFEYPNEDLRPKVSFKTNKMNGQLKVEQPHTSRVSIRKYKYDWDVYLNNSVPIDLKVSSGAAKTNLNLRGLNLKGLAVQMGIGGSTIDLSGAWKSSFSGRIEGGVGKTKLILPKNTGVKIDIDKGIGKVNANGLYVIGNQYINPCYEKAEVKIELKMDLGVGSVDLELEK